MAVVVVARRTPPADTMNLSSIANSRLGAVTTLHRAGYKRPRCFGNTLSAPRLLQLPPRPSPTTFHVFLYHDGAVDCKRYYSNGSTTHALMEKSDSIKLQFAFQKNIESGHLLLHRNATTNVSIKARGPQRTTHQLQRSHQSVDRVKEETLKALSERLSFFLSDVNLRHDKYGRSILEQHQNKYLPLDVIMKFKTIQKWTKDPNVVLEAVSLVNDDSVQMQIQHTEDGNVLIGRTIPFNYNESMLNSYNKIITIKGWPVEQNTRWIESRIRSTLSGGADGSINPVVYWGKDVAREIITIEFQSEDAAERAWDNLVQMATNDENKQATFRLVKNQAGREGYTLHAGDVTLTVCPMVLPEVDQVDDVELLTRTPESACEDTYKQKISDNSQQLTNDRASNAITTNLKRVPDALTTVDITPTVPRTRSLKTIRALSHKWWTDGTATPSLRQCIDAMDQLFKEHSALPHPSREWLHEYTRFTKHGKSQKKNRSDHFVPLELEQRKQLLKDVASLVSCTKASIDQGIIRALGGRDGYLLSEFLSRALLIYSESPPPDARQGSSDDDRAENDEVASEASISPYEACLEAFDIVHNLNLYEHQSHYSYAIRAACHEYRWEEAANLFLSQIDSSDSNEMVTGGFLPVDSSLGWDKPLEIGLYAIARDAWYKMKTNTDGDDDSDSLPSKRVFDAAMKMCMISPSGQDNCKFVCLCAIEFI